MRMTNLTSRFATSGFALLTLSAGLAAAAEKPAHPAVTPRPLVLAISMADLMRASIEIPANGIWAAAGGDKLSDDEWQLADQDAVNLIAASTLVASGGTGKNDAKWAAAADWQTRTREMEKTALQIRAAVKAMDQKKMGSSADHLQEVCESCHTKYRPLAPTDGVSRYPFYPKRELPK